MSVAVAFLGIAATLGSGPTATASEAEESNASSTLLVRVEKPARFIGFPAVCPGSSPDEDQEDVLCLAELYEAKVRVVRNLGGAPTARHLTIRFTAHSYSAVWQEDVRFLIVARPFSDKGDTGHFASYWDWEKSGKFCVAQATAASFGREPLGLLYVKGVRRIIKKDDDNWSAGNEIMCVSGGEKLVP